MTAWRESLEEADSKDSVEYQSLGGEWKDMIPDKRIGFLAY